MSVTRERVKSKNLFGHLRLEGEYNEEASKEKAVVEEQMKAVAGEMMQALTVDDDGLSFAKSLRSMMGVFFDPIHSHPFFADLTAKCDHDTISIPPTSYNSHEVNVLVHRPKKLGPGPQPAIVYVHGGGVVAGTAPMFKEHCSALAELTGVVFFNVDYRLAPETKCPENIIDFYSALKHVVENCKMLNVDPSRVGIWGESGGGYLTAALEVMLAQKDESHLVKLAVPVIPMLDDLCFTDPMAMTAEEREQAAGQQTVWKAIATDLQAQRDSKNPLLFPAKASDDLLAKFPPTVIYEREFDFYITESTRFAARLRAAGRLLEFVVIPGLGHSSCYNPDTKSFHEDLDIAKTIIQKYLVDVE